MNENQDIEYKRSWRDECRHSTFTLHLHSRRSSNGACQEEK